MKKGLFLYSIGVITIMSFFSFAYNSTTSKCIKLTCGDKVTYRLVSGENETEIVNQIKTGYPTCKWEYVSKKKCKNP
jgi:hypothetical protein